jgi:hypothetical protein
MVKSSAGERARNCQTQAATSYPDPNGLPAYSDLSTTTTHAGNDDELLLARLGYKQVSYE